MQVLRRLSEAVLSKVLPPDEARCVLTRSVLRELLAGSVLRNTMIYFMPYYVNKVGSEGLGY